MSILIAAHNEKEALERNLPPIMAAMREKDELIVVDDGSQDGSFELLKGMSVEHPIVLVRNHARQGKKRSIDIGCSKASHSHILQTDADCRPRSSEWIDRMRGPIGKGNELVLGWGIIESEGDVLGTFCSWEGARTALRYSSFALLGAPYMGVGRNLLYHRSLRERAPMPISYYRDMSGDDDLLVAYRADPSKTAIVNDPSSHTLTTPPNSWKAYWHQRRRHVQAGLRYPPKRSLPLAILDLTQLLFLLFGITLLFTAHCSSALSILLGMFYLQGIVLRSIGKELIGPAGIAFTPLFSVMSSTKRIFVDVSVLLTKPTRWQ